MIQLVYISSATRQMGEGDLLELLEQCRTRNRRQGITGMLLYRDEAFLQVLEGASEDVDEVYRSIVVDERNTGLYLIERAGIRERNFPDWTMGFENLTRLRPDQLSGYSDVFNRRDRPDAIPRYRDMAIALLLRF